MRFLTNPRAYDREIFSFLFCLIPLSFIAGNLLINLNLIIIIFYGLILYGKDIFKINYLFFEKIIIAFFILILITGVINDFYLYKNFNDYSSFRGLYATTIKSVLFLRFLLFYFIIQYLTRKNKINFKVFFIISSLAALFVSIDIFYQLIFGKDLFGYQIDSRFRKLGGPFGDEYIAGGFIQRFSLFAFFIIPVFYSDKFKKFNYILVPLLLFIFITGIILSGNRMPLILFIFTLFLIFLLEIKNKKIFFPLIIFVFVILVSMFNINNKVRENFQEFYGTISKAINVSAEMIKAETVDSIPSGIPYLSEFYSFYDTWKLNKIIGGGVKNFSFYCHDGPKKKLNIECNMHPHNYYLEILTETGLLGFLLAVTIFIKSLHLSLFNRYFINASKKNQKILIPFMFLFFIEIFPIKSTGSFFTTGNASYIFLILATLIGLIRKSENSIENRF